MASTSPSPADGYCPACGHGDASPTPEAYEEQRQRAETAEHRLRLAHQARRAKEHQLDDIRRALCDAGLMEDDDPYSHADLADVIRQNGQTIEAEATQTIHHDPKPTAPIPADDETVSGALFDEISRRHQSAINRVDELLAVIERVRAFATRLEEFGENALKDDDRKLYTAIAKDLRARIDGPPPGPEASSGDADGV